MPRSLPCIAAFFCTCLFTALITPAQALRTVPVGLGLGHLVHGVGNPPLRLSDDVVAMVSEGASEGTGIPDDQLVIVSGFVSGELTTSFVSLASVLPGYGDLSRTLVRLDAKTFVYVDGGKASGRPAFVVISDAGGANTTKVYSLGIEQMFDVDTQPPAVLDSHTMIWAATGPDGVMGTSDDRIGFALNLDGATPEIGSVPAAGALGAEAVAVSPVRAVVRGLGPDRIAGTSDDHLLLIDVIPHSVVLTKVGLPSGISAFTVAKGPVVVGTDTLVYPTGGTKHLYAVVSQTRTQPVVHFAGSTLELPAGSSLAPQPVPIAHDSFVYFNAGANRVFHDKDDEICVVSVGQTLTRQTLVPGVGLGLSDTSIPPADLGGGRLAFASDGPDSLPGTPDDGVLVAGSLLSRPTMTFTKSGVQVLSLIQVNAGTVAMEAIDSTFSFFTGLDTPTPHFTQFTSSVPCPSCFVRLNDWTLVGSAPQDPALLPDDVLTVQFPFVELYGTAQVCSTGHTLTIGRDVAPMLGTIWPATLKGWRTGSPSALVLSWYAADIALNPACRFYLDFASVFQSNIRIVDMAGQACVWNYLEPLPWLAGHSFCGQWGVSDPLGYGGLCVSSGFRVHF